MPGRCQSKHRPDRFGVPEADRHIDGGTIGQRHHWTDTGDRHQAPAHIIVPDDGQQSAMLSTSSLTRASNFTVPTTPTLRPKLRNVARRSFSMAMTFDCSSLRWVSSMRSFWLRNVFTCTGPCPHHLRDTAGIVAVRLVDLRL